MADRLFLCIRGTERQAGGCADTDRCDGVGSLSGSAADEIRATGKAEVTGKEGFCRKEAETV